ncbi:4-hydroxy-tetrahydrodipicolinate reductase [Limosilactobacillus sp. STM2_1]|uniref:4-hydroxy-tetrahydrodipicolinate reductase n=1 Tax=Limosilactobacillus rudii TaxID=2759755 RepID=A0A7W3UKE0_9LACO|nr:4-hydroxy-tetrahydrodipicolinate reductase [Limosilactobacillus rudii]MBB1078564.1 4-hydroxy-tetrahydrodipicolinate reductase [Limosilactobacillus rudii]MBB1097204.1 4-hydroxy-tetrahydrodipicolinate reductase [Limosilactobacillus rudii]MCD7133880.1 4-hydroxy-tetrahydrodipicolinate reductase [Limosilactobacillus rudii]
MKKVLIAGVTGAMGQKAVSLVNSMDNFEVSAGLAPHLTAENKMDYQLGPAVKTYQHLDEIENGIADIWIDFTLPNAVYSDVKFAIDHGMKPIVGTTGLTDDQQAELVQLSREKHVGGLIAPNFGMSAVLLMKFAQEAAKYFPDVEIIEMHHGDKKDAPSGTALSTAKMIDQVRKPHETNPEETESLAGARGGDYHGIKIHAVRLPGYIAHEQVLFGGDGEALTIRQDSFDRQSFMNGVKVALKKVDQLSELVIGLENIL